MHKFTNVLQDRFGRNHNYLRIALTEKCNLRCTYCMPSEGLKLSPNKNLMSSNEIYLIAKAFCKLGVNKIRLTGGEPLVRKELREILDLLRTLPVELTLTTNGILLDQHLSEIGRAHV